MSSALNLQESGSEKCKSGVLLIYDGLMFPLHGHNSFFMGFRGLSKLCLVQRTCLRSVGVMQGFEVRFMLKVEILQGMLMGLLQICDFSVLVENDLLQTLDLGQKRVNILKNCGISLKTVLICEGTDLCRQLDLFRLIR